MNKWTTAADDAHEREEPWKEKEPELQIQYH